MPVSRSPATSRWVHVRRRGPSRSDTHPSVPGGRGWHGLWPGCSHGFAGRRRGAPGGLTAVVRCHPDEVWWRHGQGVFPQGVGPPKATPSPHDHGDNNPAARRRGAQRGGPTVSSVGSDCARRRRGRGCHALLCFPHADMCAAALESDHDDLGTNSCEIALQLDPSLCSAPRRRHGVLGWAWFVGLTLRWTPCGTRSGREWRSPAPAFRPATSSAPPPAPHRSRLACPA